MNFFVYLFTFAILFVVIAKGMVLNLICFLLFWAFVLSALKRTKKNKKKQYESARNVSYKPTTAQ